MFLKRLLLIFGLSGVVFAHQIIVDGLDNDWTGTPAGIDSFTVDTSAGEAIWQDALDDDLGDGDYTYPTDSIFRGTEADLTELRVTDLPDSSYLYLLIRIKDFDFNWKPIVVLTLDLDHVYGSGQVWVPQNADYHVDSLIFWEFSIVIWDGWVKVFDSGWNDVTGPNSMAFFNPDSNLIEVRIDLSTWTIKPWDLGGAYYSIMVGLQDFGNFREVDDTASQWQGGGGVGFGEDHPDWVDPDVYDLGFVSSIDQANDLNTYVYNPINPDLSHPATLRPTSTRFIPHPLPHQACVCGDLDNNGIVDYYDLLYLSDYLYYSGPYPVVDPSCADENGDGTLDSKDVVYLANYLYQSGPPPVCP